MYPGDTYINKIHDFSTMDYIWIKHLSGIYYNINVKKLLEHQIIMLQSREIHPASGDIQILDWCNTCSWPSNLCALSFVSLCINMYMHCLQIVYTKQGQVWCTAVKLIMFYVQGIAGNIFCISTLTLHSVSFFMW